MDPPHAPIGQVGSRGEGKARWSLLCRVEVGDSDSSGAGEV